MSKSQIKKALMLAEGMSKDIAGNLLSGNDVRAIGYVKALSQALAETLALIDAGSDVRAEKAFDVRIQEILATLDAEHEKNTFDQSRVEESFKRFQAAGYSITDFSKGVHIDDLLKMVKAA